MTSHGAAVRYAKALFDITLSERGDLSSTASDLNAFAELIGNDALSRVLTNPAIPADRKRAVVEQLIARAGALPPPLSKLLLLLAERDRLALLSDVARAFDNRLLDYQNVIRAEVVTAVDLPDDRVRLLQQGLVQATGRDVRLSTRVDSEIIGGAVARIGGIVFDGSVTRQLERLKDTLGAATNS